MTRISRICYISILSIAVIFCVLGVALQSNVVYAQKEKQVVNYFDIESTSLRISDQGLRWVAKMDEETYKNISSKQNVSFHFIIAPTILINKADGQYMQMENKIQIDVSDFSKAYSKDGFWYINGAVNKLNPKNIAIPYSAVAVIATNIGDEITYEYTKNITSYSAYDLANNAVVCGVLEDEQVKNILKTYSFLGSENFPILCESFEDVENIKLLDDGEIFLDKIVVANYVNDVTLFLNNDKGYANEYEYAFDCDYVSVEDESIVTISDNKILAKGVGETELTITANLSNSLTVISKVNVLVRNAPVVTISTENFTIQNRYYTDSYADFKEVRPTVFVDGNKIENASFIFEIKCGSDVVSLENFGEYAKVTSLSGGTAVISIKYTDEFGVTTEKDLTVNVNSPLWYGNYDKYESSDSVKYEGIYAELPKISAGIRFDNVSLTSVSTSNIIRLQSIPGGTTNEYASTSEMAQVMYVTFIDSLNDSNYITLMIKNNGNRSSYVGARAHNWGTYTVGSTAFGFADSNGGKMGENYVESMGISASGFSLTGNYLTKNSSYKIATMLGISIVGTEVYVTSNKKTTLVIDLKYGSSLSTKSWTGFSGNTVDIVVRYASMNVDYGPNCVYVDMLGGQEVKKITNDMYFMAMGNSICSGELYKKK